MISAKQSVLIVHGSLTVRMEMAHAFELAGWKVKQSATLAAARKELREDNLFSLMILDSILPDGDVAQWLAALRKSEKQSQPPPIFLMDSSQPTALQKV